MSKIPNNLIIFEIANNHMGSVAHAKKIISEYSIFINKFKKFNFAIKFQYRDLKTFIRKDIDIDKNKHIKRFIDTKLTLDQFKKIKNYAKSKKFLTMCTPFDEPSVDHIIKHKFDFLKIASCSSNDWPLLERISSTKLPIIISVAGLNESQIDNLITFLKNRKKDFIIQHCVGEYPTPLSRMHLNQIDFLQKRYPDTRFGFSTHENPNNKSLIRIALSKGAVSLEKHVGVPTAKWPLNLYSANPQQTDDWLSAGNETLITLGKSIKRYTPSAIEKNSLLSLQRGVFVKKKLSKNSKIQLHDLKFAFPPEKNQILTSDLSKYSSLILKKNKLPNEPLFKKDLIIVNLRDQTLKYANRIKKIILKSGVSFPTDITLEISHHYGLEKFNKYGISMYTLINRNYCKKLIILIKGQTHPEQYHKKKEETFHILFGKLFVKVNGYESLLRSGDMITIKPGDKHIFWSKEDCIFEEISSRHIIKDSYYTDPDITKNKDRKSFIKIYLD